MQRLLLLAFLAAGCNPVVAVEDGDTTQDGSSDDGGTMVDAPPVPPDTDAPSYDAGRADVDLTVDAPLPSLDTAPEEDTGGSSHTAECGDTFIDAPETCDPAYEGGSHSSIACASTGENACQWCPMGAVRDLCVYGDYGSDPRADGWTNACRSSARNQLHWVTWHSASERDAILDAYREIATIGGGTTDVSGWIGLRAADDGSQFRWEDDDSLIAPSILPPIRNSRSAGRNCLTLYVTDDDAYMMYSTCTGSEEGLCFTETWGERR